MGRGWPDMEHTGFTLATGRSPLENRPWSPAPAPARDDRIVRPGHAGSHGADPADTANEPEGGSRRLGRLPCLRRLERLNDDPGPGGNARVAARRRALNGWSFALS
jgi:hypothetical protein